MGALMSMVENGWVPEAAVRYGIRRVIGHRLQTERARYEAEGRRFEERLVEAPIAHVPDLANAQHYEVPARFYELVLGRRLKYSAGFWAGGIPSLDRSEEAMLALTAKRAELEDGQTILELGCGWGSLTLWMAERFPNSNITAISNSASQRTHILEKAHARGLVNVHVITADMNDFDATVEFDRVVSVEMFEHMRNWPVLLERVRRWVADDGRVFIHVFAHRAFTYPYETTADDDWIGRTFFTGGMMPSVDLLDRIEHPFEVDQRWIMAGTNYQKTAEAWLENLIRNKPKIVELFSLDMSPTDAARQWERWRIFFYALSETFGYRDGTEWRVAHYSLVPSAKEDQR